MSRLEAKLRLHFADKDAVWRGSWPGAVVAATWEEDGTRLLLGVQGPLFGTRVVDAVVQSLSLDAPHVTVACDGFITASAVKAAARFGVDLLDATHLPETAPSPAPVVAAPEPAAAAPEPEPGEVLLLLAPAAAVPLLVAHVAHAPPAEPAYDVSEGLVAAMEADALPAAWPPRRIVAPPTYDVPDMLVAGLEAGALPDVWPPRRVLAPPTYDVPEMLFAGLEAGALPDVWPPPRVARAFEPTYDVDESLFPALDAALPPIDELPFIDPGSGVLDEALLGEVDGLVHALEDEPVLPWTGPPRDVVIEAARVDPLEVMAMPWHHPAVALPDEQIEVMPGNARPMPLAPVFRPTQAPDWGLPWPRPLTPADGLAIADPSLWSNRERMRAVHEDLERRGGASFGQVKPDGSAWLRRLQSGL